jgi:hypothetical protein
MAARLQRPTSEALGRTVFGPVFAEFCLRMHLLTSLLEAQRPGDGVLLFCARGGLRMQLGWERFLVATGLPEPMPAAPLMVSRLAAIRPAVARTLTEDLPGLLPAVERTVAYEFARNDLAHTVRALSGAEAAGVHTEPTTPAGLAALLRSPDGAAAAAAIVEQGALFTRHLDAARAGRSMPVLVDTGLFGTTRAVLADAYPDLDVRSLLLARTLRADLVEQQRGTFGLSVEAEVYSSIRRRTALMRYWHFVEWLFEPSLPSVTRFEETPDGVRSNLETPGWQHTLEADPGSVFAGVLAHLDGLRPDTVADIPRAADRAWSGLRRAVVWPTPAVGHALGVGTRSHDFGREGTWEATEWTGPVNALRGSVMWREGIIARSGGRWRLPLLAAIEAAYSARAARQRLTALVRRGR